MTSTFLTSTKLLPGFTTPLARYEAAEGVFEVSEAKRRRVLEKDLSCCERKGDGVLGACDRKLDTDERAVGVWEAKDRRARADGRVSAKHR